MSELKSTGARLAAISRVFATGGFAIKTAGSAIAKNVTAITYTVANVWKTAFGAATDFVFGSTLSNMVVPDGYTCLFVLAIKASDGTSAVIQSDTFFKAITIPGVTGTRYQGYKATKQIDGTTRLVAELSSAKWMSDHLPTNLQLEGYLPVGVVKIPNASGADFVPGTTALDATNTVAVYTNIAGMPDEVNF